MDRKLFKLPFSLDNPADWACPTCGKGLLRVRKETFFKTERRRSRSHSHEAWEPAWIEYVYSTLFVCTNDQCKEVVASAGVGSVDSYEAEDEDGNWHEGHDDFFHPRFFEPHLVLFQIPVMCPPSVSEPLHESFKVFFASPNAASNHVRTAIEALLTELGVKRFNVTKKQRRTISLHQRIKLLPPKYGGIAEVLLAIKWLGNAGSHASGTGEGGVSMDDVLDAYEFTEHILQEIFLSKAKAIVAKAKKVNKKRGPLK